MQEFLDKIFYFNGTAITIGTVIAVCAMGLLALLFHFFVVKKMLSYYFQKGSIDTTTKIRLNRLLGSCILLIFLISAAQILRLNQGLYLNEYFHLSWVTISRGLLIIQFARLINLFLGRSINRYYQNQILADKESRERLPEDSNKITSSSISFAIILLALFLFLQNFQFDPVIFPFREGTDNPFFIKLSTLLVIGLVIIIGRVFIWALTQLILLNYYNKNKVNVGTQYAINQLISYFVYVVAILYALHFLNINMTVLWGGLAALLVGVGLGLQQTFNDLFSGLLLLFERGIEVGEVLEIDGTVGSLKKIGLRTSILESRDNISIIVPNSKLVVNNVINWSHFDDKVRFRINVGVAYGSDTALIKEILLDIAKDHSFVLKYPSPRVRFTNFGNSSLDFELLFFSKNFIIIEDVKSDIRLAIDQRFRAAGITIPFPQTDVWLRKDE